MLYSLVKSVKLNLFLYVSIDLFNRDMVVFHYAFPLLTSLLNGAPHIHIFYGVECDKDHK